jgi:hypothetical protein
MGTAAEVLSTIQDYFFSEIDCSQKEMAGTTGLEPAASCAQAGVLRPALLFWPLTGLNESESESALPLSKLNYASAP